MSFVEKFIISVPTSEGPLYIGDSIVHTYIIQTYRVVDNFRGALLSKLITIHKNNAYTIICMQVFKADFGGMAKYCGRVHAYVFPYQYVPLHKEISSFFNSYVLALMKSASSV